MPQQVIDWDPVEKACIAGMSLKEASQCFHVKYATVRKRAARYRWPIPSKINKRINQLTKSGETAIQAAAESWIQRSDRHRDVAFRLGHESLAKMRPRAPANFREAELADKIARRAAGLDTADNVSQTLIQLNEASCELPIELASANSDDKIIDADVGSSTSLDKI